jgi:molybdopterin/thiamine biosynthesis adenylyltransferase
VKMKLARCHVLNVRLTAIRVPIALQVLAAMTKTRVRVLILAAAVVVEVVPALEKTIFVEAIVAKKG